MAFPIAAIAAAICAVPTAASPQPEFLALEPLQSAAEQRSALRAEVRQYIKDFVPVCPPKPRKKYEAGFLGIVSELSTLIESMQDTQLILDVNIAYQDELDAVVHQRTLVRCSIGEINEDQAQTLLNAALAKLQDIRSKANAALLAIELAQAELNDGASR